jgi:hypothetical protein
MSIGWRTEVVFGGKNINLIFESIINGCEEQLSKKELFFYFIVPYRD